MENETFPAYLILGVRGSISKDFPQKITFPQVFPPTYPSYSIVTLCNKHQIHYGIDDEHRQEMVLIESPRDRQLKLGDAMDLMHGLQAVLAVKYFCITRVGIEYSLLPITGSLLSTQLPWSLYTIISKSKTVIEDFLDSRLDFTIEFNSYSLEPIGELIDLMPALKEYILDNGKQRAFSYLFSSMKQLEWDVCDWRNENFSPDSIRYVTISEAESAFQNAYKCIEALIGDPGKSNAERKVRTRLQTLRIDPNEEVGYVGKESVLEKFMRYYSMRDSIAAHGSGSHKRPIKMGEIIDLQALARHILLTPIYTTSTQ